MCKSIQEMLTVQEEQKTLWIGNYPMYDLIHSHSFPAVKTGRAYRIPKELFIA